MSQKWLVIFLLWLGFGLLTFSIQRNDLTNDAPAQITSGYAYLSAGRTSFWLLEEHRTPPLINIIESGLVYLSEPDIQVETVAGWQASFPLYFQSFMKQLSLPLAQVQLLSRIPIILLTLLLGAIVFALGKTLWNWQAGLFALMLFCFDPNVLAHGGLATTDMGSVLMGVVAFWGAWHFRQKPTWRLAGITGGGVGLALLAKQTGVLWMGVIGLILAGDILWLVKKNGYQKGRVLLMQTAVVFGVGLFILWVGYAFSWGPLLNLPFSVPAPEYWQGLIDQTTSTNSRFVFALGYRQYGGWWWYFPVAFLLKNPLPFIILFLLGLVMLFGDKKAHFLLYLFPVVYVATAVRSGLNIGYRHLLPIHPFLHLLIGRTISVWLEKPSFRLGRQALMVGLGLWCVVGTLSAWPNEIGYFNELVGGEKNAYRYLIDSNLDWGQVSVEPLLEKYPTSQRELPDTPYNPPAGLYIVSASGLQGLTPNNPFGYEWFRHILPTEVWQGTWLLYKVPRTDLGWLAQCAVPVVPLSDELISQNLGGLALRRVHFDCSQSWLYPGGLEEAGLYALDHDLYDAPRFDWRTLTAVDPVPHTPFIARHLAAARLSFDKSFKDDSPAFVLSEILSQKLDLPPNESIYVVPEAVSPAHVAPETKTESVLEVGKGLAFLGIQSYQKGDVLEVESWWRYEQEEALTRPFAIMAHLVDEDGRLLAVADGLGVPLSVLQEGDIFVQKHEFPASGGPFWFQTTIYWSDSLERWPILDDNQNILLMPVVIANGR